MSEKLSLPKTTRLSVGVVIRHEDIVSIEPWGDYPDEVTLVMRSGKRYPAGSGYNKTRAQTLAHWQRVIEGEPEPKRRQGDE